MRILHTADWHLGRIFHGVHLTEDQAYILDELVRITKDAEPDVVIIAGDVYDRAVPPVEAVKLLDDTLTRLVANGKAKVILVAGNHDSPERLGFAGRLLVSKGLHIVGEPRPDTEPIVIHDNWGPVYFCPIPYCEPQLVREQFNSPEVGTHEQAMDLLVSHTIRRLPRGARSVAVAHAFVAGSETSESERPLAVGAAGTVSRECFLPFNYTALGHLHRPQEAGGNRIRYSGSILKYSFAETSQRKSVSLVELDGDGNVALEEIPLVPRRDVRCIEGYMAELLEGPPDGGSPYDYLMITLLDEGVILDAMGRLRERYPNLLHIARPQLVSRPENIRPSADHRRLTVLDLFSSFFQQVTSKPLGEKETASFVRVIEELRMKERKTE